MSDYTLELAVVFASIIAVTGTAAVFARLIEFVPLVLRLAAVGAVAADLPLEFLFGFMNPLGALVVTFVGLRGRSSSEQKEPAQHRCE